MQDAHNSAVVEIEVKYDHTSQLELAEKAAPLTTLIEETTLELRDQETLTRLNDVILAGREWLKGVDAIMDPVRDATHKAWKAAIKAQDDFKAPVLMVIGRAQQASTAFIIRAREEEKRLQDEADAEARRKQAVLDAEQRRANEAEAARVAEEMRQSGASREVIREAKAGVLATPAPMVAPKTVNPTVIAPKGQAVRMYYSAEITDMRALLQYLASDNRWVLLLGMSDGFKKSLIAELRAEAEQLKDKFEIPGTKLLKNAGGVFGARR